MISRSLDPLRDAWYDYRMIPTNPLPASLALDALNALSLINDDNTMIIRILLIDPTTELAEEFPEWDATFADAILALLDSIRDDRELFTELLLANSLCPLHCIDYAICFDDDDDECLSIRMIHPAHDS
jgi:hypothetical protein